MNKVKNLPAYRAWTGMKQRCSNPNDAGYRYYGGRGISVCRRWKNNFRLFEEDMGPKPTPEHSIDRIDNDGNYEPGNCRWATRKQQMQNCRYRKGGESSPMSKLREQDVIEIRLKRMAGVSVAALAKEYSVSDACASEASNGRKWKYLNKTHPPYNVLQQHLGC